MITELNYYILLLEEITHYFKISASYSEKGKPQNSPSQANSHLPQGKGESVCT